MKTIDTLTNLFKHNLWANQRILEECAKLTSEQLDKSIEGTFGAIRDTLEHITRAELAYFSRISTGELYKHPEGAPPMTIPEMTASLEQTGKGLTEWAAKVQPGDTVTLDWDGQPRDVPKTVILTQVINHATEHRAQIMATMTQLGVQPPELDSWTYFEQMDKS